MSKDPGNQRIRLRIEAVVDQAEAIARRVEAELPGHSGLQGAASQAAAAAARAGRVSASLKRPFSLHRLPVVFLAVALAGLAGLLYWQFLHAPRVTLALPAHDAARLREELRERRGTKLDLREVPGSREALLALQSRKVDLAFVQGGLPIPSDCPRVELPSPEIVLFLVRGHPAQPRLIRRVLTSDQGEGSHAVAQALLTAWGATNLSFLHEWRALTTEPGYPVGDDLDAVLVVKDPADERTSEGLRRLVAAGFRLVPLDLGARAIRMDYLRPATLAPGYLASDPRLPAEPLETYQVATWLVARPGLTPRVLARASQWVERRVPSLAEAAGTVSPENASELFQGLEAVLSILVTIGLAFIALLGLDVVAYRRSFHELNSLVSIISMLQSNKDLVGEPDPARRSENLLYLGLCSDLLGLVSTISAYYTQENSSLLFNQVSEVVHQRCDSLKINIQLKILHALIPGQGDR